MSKASEEKWRKNYLVKGPHNAAGGLKVPTPGGYERAWRKLMGCGTWYGGPGSAHSYYSESKAPSPTQDWTREAKAWSFA